MNLSLAHILLAIIFSMCMVDSFAKKEKKEKKYSKDSWKNKNIADYNDADMERLLEEWEENDEDELEEDELPEWKREPPKVDMSNIDPNDPEDFLKQSKKGRTLMMFATVSGPTSEAESEKISQLWHSSLFNAHIDTQRYVVGENRVLFMLKDGSQAWPVKDFLVKQDRCEEVTIEGQSYPGAGAQKKDSSKTGKEQKEEL